MSEMALIKKIIAGIEGALLLFLVCAGASASELEGYYFNPAGIVNNLGLTEAQRGPVQLIMKDYADRVNAFAYKILDELMPPKSFWEPIVREFKYRAEANVAVILSKEQLGKWRRLMHVKEVELIGLIEDEGRHRRDLYDEHSTRGLSRMWR